MFGFYSVEFRFFEKRYSWIVFGGGGGEYVRGWRRCFVVGGWGEEFERFFKIGEGMNFLWVLRLFFRGV